VFVVESMSRIVREPESSRAKFYSSASISVSKVSNREVRAVPRDPAGVRGTERWVVV
jgi:hypothetical protein